VRGLVPEKTGPLTPTPFPRVQGRGASRFNKDANVTELVEDAEQEVARDPDAIRERIKELLEARLVGRGLFPNIVRELAYRKLSRLFPKILEKSEISLCAFHFSYRSLGRGRGFSRGDRRSPGSPRGSLAVSGQPESMRIGREA
jgi:hypothetical protein